jgi:hypothetical protein
MDEACMCEKPALTLRELEAQITELAGHLNAANSRWLSLICRFHHRQVHEGRVVIQRLDDSAVRFLRPDGQSFDSVAPDHTRPLCDWQQLPAVHDQQGIRIDKTTATTRWRGEKMDYGLAIEVLFQQARREPAVSAESQAV